MKRDVGTVLQKLIRDKVKADYETDTQGPTRHDLTSLGVPLTEQDDGRFLRISIEDAAASRLQLKHIPHRVVDNLDRQYYLPDIQNMAMQIHQGILRECQNYRAEYKEIPEQQPDLFDHLRNGGLTGLTTILFRWPADDARILLLKQKNEFSLLLNKEIMLLEDPDVLGLLKNGHMIGVKEK